MSVVKPLSVAFCSGCPSQLRQGLLRFWLRIVILSQVALLMIILSLFIFIVLTHFMYSLNVFFPIRKTEL